MGRLPSLVVHTWHLHLAAGLVSALHDITKGIVPLSLVSHQREIGRSEGIHS